VFRISTVYVCAHPLEGRVRLLWSYMQFLCGIWSQVLCCPLKRLSGEHTGYRTVRRGSRHGHHATFPFLTKRFNVVLRFRTTRVRVPLARNPSPLQYPTLHVHWTSVRSLLRQPRSALEAGPLRLTPSASLKPPRHVYIGRAALSLWSSCFSALTKGTMGNNSLGWSVIHFRGRWIRSVSCYTLLSGCRLPWPPSNCPNPPTPFHVSRMSPKALTPHVPLRFIPHRLLRLPKKAHLVPLFFVNPPLPSKVKSGSLAHLKFENRSIFREHQCL